MKKLPSTHESLVLRTDFSNAATWEEICIAIQEPQTENEFRAMVECISDPAFSGLTPENVVSLSAGSNRSFVFLVDSQAVSSPEHPILVVDLHSEPGLSAGTALLGIWPGRIAMIIIGGWMLFRTDGIVRRICGASTGRGK